MLSQKTIDKMNVIYQNNPEEVKRLAEFGDIFEKAIALTILEVVGVSK